MKTWWLLLVAWMTVAASGPNAPQTADDVIKFSSTKMADYKTWSADIRQSINLMGVPMTLQGRTWFKMPRWTRTEMQMPLVGALGKMTVVMGEDGLMWQEMDMLGRKQVAKMDMNKLVAGLAGETDPKLQLPQNPDPARQWEQSRQFMNFKLLPAVTLENQPMWVLEGTWKPEIATNPVMAAQTTQIGKMRLYIGQQDGFTHRVEQFEPAKDKPAVTMEFTKLKFNEKLDDAMFQYKPPNGTQVIDITEISRQMLQQGSPSSSPKP